MTRNRRDSEARPKQELPKATYASSALFRGLRESEVRAMLDKASWADYPARTWLFRQGEPGRQFFFVESGLIRLSQLTAEGEDLLVQFVKPGEVFGYFALTLRAQNAVSAQTMQPSRLAIWDRETALQLLQSTPEAAMNLFDIAVHEVVYFYDRTRHLITQGVGGRVVWALSELVRTIGVSTPAGVVISHGIGQRELAELAGTTIFTVSRELTKLQRQGILKKQRGRIVVLQPENLSDW